MKRSCPSRGIWQPAQSWVLVLSLCSEVERRNCLLHHLPFLFFLVNFVCNPFGKKIIYWVLPWGLLFSGVRNSCCWLKLCANILECVIPMGYLPWGGVLFHQTQAVKPQRLTQFFKAVHSYFLLFSIPWISMMNRACKMGQLPKTHWWQDRAKYLGHYFSWEGHPSIWWEEYLSCLLPGTNWWLNTSRPVGLKCVTGECLSTEVACHRLGLF